MNQLMIMQSIIATIQIKDKVTRKYLAKKYEVSERTITRYIYFINQSGIPIVSNSGRNGGYSLLEDYKYNNMFSEKTEICRMITSLENTKHMFDDKLNENIITKLNAILKSKTL